MPFKRVALKITKHFYKNESAISPKIELNSSDYCKLFPENAYLCSFSASHMAKEYINWTDHYCPNAVGGHKIRNGIVIFFIMIIFCVSLFSNCILCKIVFFTKVRSTANIVIGNLSISDILLTVVNLPIQFISIALHNWPFGSVMCKSIRFVQGLSVATSSFSMAYIALDRYHLIAHPLKAKPTLYMTLRKLIFIWISSAVISLPYIFMAQIQKSHLCQENFYCKIKYPEPRAQNRKLFTILSFFCIYLIPLTFSAITYIRICIIIKKRNIVGSVTNYQMIRHKGAKQKTIKLLIVVLITFALCWLPINIYHIYNDFSDSFLEKHKASVNIPCHMIAMSSVCYNPFIYFWMNKKFKKSVKSYIKRILYIGKIKECEHTFWATSKKRHNYKTAQRLRDAVTKKVVCSVHSKTNSGCILMTDLQQISEKTKS